LFCWLLPVFFVLILEILFSVTLRTNSSLSCYIEFMQNFATVGQLQSKLAVLVFLEDGKASSSKIFDASTPHLPSERDSLQEFTVDPLGSVQS
jgi:hypothetical protein